MSFVAQPNTQQYKDPRQQNGTPSNGYSLQKIQSHPTIINKVIPQQANALTSSIGQDRNNGKQYPSYNPPTYNNNTNGNQQPQSYQNTYQNQNSNNSGIQVKQVNLQIGNQNQYQQPQQQQQQTQQIERKGQKNNSYVPQYANNSGNTPQQLTKQPISQPNIKKDYNLNYGVNLNKVNTEQYKPPQTNLVDNNKAYKPAYGKLNSVPEKSTQNKLYVPPVSQTPTNNQSNFFNNEKKNSIKVQVINKDSFLQNAPNTNGSAEAYRPPVVNNNNNYKPPETYRAPVQNNNNNYVAPEIKKYETEKVEVKKHAQHIVHNNNSGAVQQQYKAPEINSYKSAEPYKPPVVINQNNNNNQYQKPSEPYKAPTQNDYKPPANNNYQPPAQQAYQPPVSNNYQPPAAQPYKAPTTNEYKPPVINQQQVNQQQYKAPEPYKAPSAGNQQQYKAPEPYKAPAAGNQQQYKATEPYKAPAAVNQQQYKAPEPYKAPTAVNQQQYKAPEPYKSPNQQQYKAPEAYKSPVNNQKSPAPVKVQAQQQQYSNQNSYKKDPNVPQQPLIETKFGKFEKMLGVYGYSESDFLGKGAFGKVYKGTNKDTGEIVAIKTMDNSMFTSKQMKDSLDLEINVMKELKSANVVRMYDLVKTDTHTNLVLELCPDGDLKQHLDKVGGRLEEQKATLILFQVLQGFKDLINHGYIHRDIKPENTLIKGEYFKLGDFGLAAKVDTTGVKLMKEFVGSPLYMAPQLLENQPYSIKSDIWSIGLMFYEILFGKTPWPARDVNSLKENVKNMPLRFPYGCNIGKNTKSFIEGCLQKTEEKRFGWDEVFSHPIFLQSGDRVTYVKVDSRSKSIIQSIQQSVQLKGLDLRELFDKYDQDNGGTLDSQEFYKMLSTIDTKVTNYEAIHLFELLLENGDGNSDKTINFDVFRKIMIDYDFVDLNDKGASILTDLREIIKINKIDLQVVFNKFDYNKIGDLTFDQFKNLIRSFAPALSRKEVQHCFEKFDDDSNGFVSYEEFHHHLSYGIKHLHDSYDPQKEKAKKLIKQIKEESNKRNVSIRKLFQEFDKDGNDSLDFVEFNQLMQQVDSRLPKQDIQSLYDYFDENNDGSIQQSEFLQLLE